MSCCMLYRTFHFKAHPMVVPNCVPAGSSVPAQMTSWLPCFYTDCKCWVFKDNSKPKKAETWGEGEFGI